MAQKEEKADQGPEQPKPGSDVPKGRISRFSRLAKMGASVSAVVASKAIKKGVTGAGRAAKKSDPGVEPDEEQKRRELVEEAHRLTETYGLTVEAAQRIVDTLGEMKGAAMKFGQQLAMEQDFLPPEVRPIVAKLWNQAPFMEFDKLRSVVERELEGPLGDHFEFVDPNPFAAASLGQVHRARLKNGDEAAIKIQYPGVDEALINDLKNLGAMVKTLAAMTGKSRVASAYFKEVAVETENELDYIHERRNIRAMKKALEPWPDIVVPQFHRRHSSHRVLTMGFIEGTTLKDLVNKGGYSEQDAHRIGTQLIRAVLGPFFHKGIIHADPHPGNWLILPDGRLGVLDFGCVKTLPEEFVKTYLFLAHKDLVEAEEPDLLAALTSAGFKFDIPEESSRQILNDISKMIRRPLAAEHYDFGQSTLILEVRAYSLKRTRDFMHIEPPTEAIFFFRALLGLVQNLKALGAKGDFRAVAQELVRGDYLNRS